ncbi:MAG: hypothetical protein M0P69_16185 [Bacteroidales bacterium]|jgi:hypothetical protein|nr:hypothetical protein [Bacteroidales bacterium]
MGATDNKPIDTTAAAAENGKPSPKDTGTAANSGAGAGAGAGTRTRTRKAKPVVAADLVAQQPEIVSVTIPEPAQPAAPKRSHKKKPAPAAPPDLTQLENNIEYVTAAGFGMVGLATKNPDVWMIRADELEQISKPAARLVERAGQLETTNKYADYALLLGALALVVLPRILLTKTMNAQQRQPQQSKREVTNAGQNDGSDRNTERKAADPVSNDGADPIAALYEIN